MENLSRYTGPIALAVDDRLGFAQYALLSILSLHVVCFSPHLFSGLLLSCPIGDKTVISPRLGGEQDYCPNRKGPWHLSQ